MHRSGTVSFAVVGGLVRLTDGLMLLLAGALVAPRGTVLLAPVVAAVAASLCLARDGAYTPAVLRSGAHAAQRLVKPLVVGVFCLIAALYMTSQGSLPARSFPPAWAGCAALLLWCGRWPWRRRLRRWSASGRLARKIAIVGVGAFSQEFIARVADDPKAYRLVGIYDDRIGRVPPEQDGVPVLGTVADLVEHSRCHQVDVIVIALPLSAVERIRVILDQLASTVADIVLTTDLAGLRFSPAEFAGIGRNPVVSVREAPLKDWRALEKTALDYGVGLLALLVLSPLLLATALLIWLDSPGPVLFRQPRLGFNNRLFVCFKFRSMHHAMADRLADRQATRNDPRLTRVGRVIRRLSIDELPQLLNVLNGTMSLVGPRPHAPNTKAADRLFTEVVQLYALRHRVKPGITGWAQVNGWRGETTTVAQIEQRVACDLFYIENWSVTFDLRIMLMTVLHEVHSKTAF